MGIWPFGKKRGGAAHPEADGRRTGADGARGQGREEVYEAIPEPLAGPRDQHRPYPPSYERTPPPTVEAEAVEREDGGAFGQSGNSQETYRQQSYAQGRSYAPTDAGFEQEHFGHSTGSVDSADSSGYAHETEYQRERGYGHDGDYGHAGDYGREGGYNEHQGYGQAEDFGQPQYATAQPIDKDISADDYDEDGGVIGPFDGDTVEIDEFDFSDYAIGILNLGSMRIPLGRDLHVQVDMGEQGPRMLHLVTTDCRITPVAFAAPNNGGQWYKASEEIVANMKRDGSSDVHFVEGPWDREIVATVGSNLMRVIGIDGPRWMLRLMVASPAANADSAARTAYELAARTFVYRGQEALLAGTSLPLTIPAQIVEQLQAALEEKNRRQAEANRQQEVKARAQVAPEGSGARYDQQTLDEAAQALQAAQARGAAEHQ